MAEEVVYLRFNAAPENQATVLSGKTVKVSKGGIVDIVSWFDLGRVDRSPGIFGQSKRDNGVTTYRFSVPENAIRNMTYMLCFEGFPGEVPPFTFKVQVG